MRRLPQTIASLAGSAGTAAAGLAGAAALVSQGGRMSSSLDLLTNLAPLYLACGLVGLLTASLSPLRRRQRILIALVAIAASVALIAPELSARNPSCGRLAGEAGLKVIQFNAWRGNIDTATVVDWLAREAPDLVFIEEATPRLRDQLLARTGWRVVGARTTVMIFSPHPLIGRGVRPVIEKAPAPTWVNAVLLTPAGATPVFATHYTWPIWRPTRLQGEVLAHAVAAFPKDGAILGGDFNATGFSFALRDQDRVLGMQRRTHALPTWPAMNLGPVKLPIGIFPIDHLYAGASWRTVCVRRGPWLGSDHFPIVLALARRGA